MALEEGFVAVLSGTLFGVDKHLVSLLQHQLSGRDQHFALSVYKYDERLTRDVEVLDLLSVPAVVLLEHDLLDIFEEIIGHRLSADDQLVAYLYDYIAARYDSVISSLDYGDDSAVRHTDILDHLPDPVVVVPHLDFDEVYRFLLLNVLDLLGVLILSDKTGGYDTCRDGYEAYTEEGDDYSQELAQEGDRVYVSITDR